jgi:hypothetical protein
VAKFRQTLSDPDTRGLGAVSTSGETAGVVGRGLQNLAALGEDVLDVAVSRKEAQASQALSAGMQEARSQDEALAGAEAEAIYQASQELPTNASLFAGNNEEDIQAVLQAKTALNRIEKARLSRTNKDLHQRAFLAAHMNNKFLDADDISRAARSITGGSNATDMYKELAEAQSINEENLRRFFADVPAGHTPESYWKLRHSEEQAKLYQFGENAMQDELNKTTMISNMTFEFQTALSAAGEITEDVAVGLLATLDADIQKIFRQAQEAYSRSGISGEKLNTKLSTLRTQLDTQRKNAVSEIKMRREMRKEDLDKLEDARHKNFINNMTMDEKTKEGLFNLGLDANEIGDAILLLETVKPESLDGLRGLFANHLDRVTEGAGLSPEAVELLKSDYANADAILRLFAQSIENALGRGTEGRDDLIKLLVGKQEGGGYTDGYLRLRYSEALQGMKPVQHLAVEALTDMSYSPETSDDTSGILDSQGRPDPNAIIHAWNSAGLGEIELTPQTLEYMKTKSSEWVEEIKVMQGEAALHPMDGSGNIKWKMENAFELRVPREAIDRQPEAQAARSARRQGSSLAGRAGMPVGVSPVGTTTLEDNVRRINTFIYLLHHTGNADLAEKIYEAVEQKAQNVEEVVEEQTTTDTKESTETAEVVQYSDLPGN